MVHIDMGAILVSKLAKGNRLLTASRPASHSEQWSATGPLFLKKYLCIQSRKYIVYRRFTRFLNAPLQIVQFTA
jgi:hypothetical protein